jgi:hypothetical protein
LVSPTENNSLSAIDWYVTGQLLLFHLQVFHQLVMAIDAGTRRQCHTSPGADSNIGMGLLLRSTM